ncbi:MAG: hypothetical protein CME06_15665 [Gemmatimonadetes bacterium]|nr:hypothetical protein [Gemmatimonadota bacterium]
MRERLEDLEELTTVSLQRAKQRLGLDATPVLDIGSIKILSNWQWPGNIRELHGFVERLAARTLGRVIPHSLCRSELELWMRERPDVAKSKMALSDLGLKTDVRRYEISRIRQALEMHGGVKTAAARSLCIPEATLRSRMKALGIESGTPARRAGI